MSDPVGLIGHAGGLGPIGPNRPAGPASTQGPEKGHGPNFKDVLLENLNEVNKLQQDAAQAAEDLAAGRRGDVEGVILATEKADTAFRMLQAVRNKVIEAYDELKQMRV